MSSDLTSNPLAKRIAMVECAGGKAAPRLEITFKTIEDMHAASDFIRGLSEPAPAQASKEQVHELKTWPEYFGPIADGRKTFEVRRNDRGFKTGDTLHLREWEQEPDGGYYTGREIRVSVLGVYSNLPGVHERHVVMSIGRPSAEPSGRCTCEHGIQNDRDCAVHGAQLRKEDGASEPPSDRYGRREPPYGYAYRYHGYGGDVLRFNNGQEVNGSKPFETVPYWIGTAVTKDSSL